MKKLVYCSLAAIGLMACSKIEPVTTVTPAKTGDCFSIPLEMEDISLEGEDSKAYLAQYESSWKYEWEDGDHIDYFQYRRGVYFTWGQAEVDKTPDYTRAVFYGQNFIIGDAIYSYLEQPDAETMLSDIGINSNNNASDFYMCIPTMQYSESEEESYYSTEDNSFSVVNISKDLMTGYTSSATNIVNRTAEAKRLKFRIENYNTDIQYCCGEDATNIDVDPYGNSSVLVSFKPFNNTNKSGSTYYAYSNATVYAAGFEAQKVTIPVKAIAKKKTFLGLPMGYTISYEFTQPAVYSSSVISEISGVTGTKKYPVRNCMPCATKCLNLTSNLINYPDEISSATTMYMLGSVMALNVYSTVSSVAVGDSLKAVIFQASDNCAGVGTYNILSEDLTLRDMTESTIMSEDKAPQLIANSKADGKPLYLILAPGTYSGAISIFTDKNVYSFIMPEVPFNRAGKKTVNCDLSKAASVMTLAEFYALMEGGDEGDEEGGEEEGSDDEDIELWSISGNTYAL